MVYLTGEEMIHSYQKNSSEHLKKQKKENISTLKSRKTVSLKEDNLEQKSQDPPGRGLRRQAGSLSLVKKLHCHKAQHSPRQFGRITLEMKMAMERDYEYLNLECIYIVLNFCKLGLLQKQMYITLPAADSQKRFQLAFPFNMQNCIFSRFYQALHCSVQIISYPCIPVPHFYPSCSFI